MDIKRVANWARALGITEPIFRRRAAAREAGYHGRPVPAPMYAFFHVVPGEVLPDELGFTWGKTLAGAQEFVVGQAACEGDRLTGRSFVESAWERTGSDGTARQFLRLTTDFRTGRDDLVCRNSVLFVERKDGPADELHERDAEPDRVHAALPGLTMKHGGPLPAPEAGRQLPPFSVGPVDMRTMAQMSVATDNPDPVHLDGAAALQAGLPGVIGHGATVVSALWEPVRRWAGIERVRRAATKQRLPFRPGDALLAGGTVTGVRLEDGVSVAGCDTWLIDGCQTVIGTGSFDVVVG
jgi:acyl dehydratase